MFSGASSDLLAVWGSSDGDVWAVGRHGTVLWYNGMCWYLLESGTTHDLVDVHGGSSSLFIISNGEVYGADPSNFWLVKALNTDGDPSSICTGRSIWVSETGNYCLVGGFSNYKYSQEWGEVWGLGESITAVRTFEDVWGVSESVVFALGEPLYWPGDQIYNYNGSWWSALPHQPPENLKRIAGTSTHETFGVTEQGRLAFLDSTGWSMTDSTPASFVCNGLWGSSIHDIFLVGRDGDEGKIIHFNGYDYEIYYGLPYEELCCDLRDVWAFSADDAYAVGGGDGICRYGGDEWTSILMTPSGFTGIWANSPNDIFAACEEGYVFHYDGLEWSRWRLTTGRLWDIAANDSNDVYAVGGPFQNVFHYNGNSWTSMNDLGSVCRTVFCTNGVAFIGTETGDVWRFDGFDPDQRTKYPDVLSYEDQGKSILTMWGSSPDTLYIGGNAPHFVQWNGGTGVATKLISPSGYDIERITAISGKSGTELFVAAGTFTSPNQSHIFRYDGVEMVPDTTSIAVINAIYIMNNCTGFAVGNDGLILYLGDSNGPTPVFFRQFFATVSERSVLLFWDVAGDVEIEALRLYRWESASPERKALHAQIDPAGRSYTDEYVRPGASYAYQLLAVDRNGHETWSQEIGAQVPVVALELLQNHPNPFNPYTTIRFRIPDRQHVVLAIYDVSGQHIRTLMSAPCEQGEASLEWNGRDASGNAVGSGIYFYQLKAGSKKLSKKMVLLR